MMAMNSTLMNKIYQLKKKYHCNDRSMTEMKVKNRKIVILPTNALETKVVFLQKENSILHSKPEKNK